MHPHEVYGLNKRAFEACGIGAFQMLDWTPGLSQLFEPGEEVVVFRHMQELKEKLNYYLEHDDERRRIAEAGKRRAAREHTYEDRLELMLTTVFGDAQGFSMPELEISPRTE
jgi:spore maturation protein CgeB